MTVSYSTRARIAGTPFAAVAWGAEVTEYINKAHGLNVQMATRVGGPQEVIWVSTFDTMAALEASLQKTQADAGYQSRISKGTAEGHFDPSSIETAIWVTP